MKKAPIMIAQVIVGMLIGMGANGCISQGLVLLVVPYIYLWILTAAIVHHSYEEHVRAILRFDATMAISISVAAGPVFLGVAVCAELR